MRPFAMSQALFLIPVVTPLVMLAGVPLLPRSFADAGAQRVRGWVTAVAALQFSIAVVIAILAAGQWLSGPSGGWTALWTEGTAAAGAGRLPLIWDGVSCSMYLMVSLIGWVICRYSVRYLDGDAGQGNFFRWTGFTLGAVSLMVITGDLVIFYVAWLLTSLGLHQLLLHHRTRPAAQRAAWAKFTVMRIADVALAIALILLIAEFETTRWTAIFADLQSSVVVGAKVQLAAALLVIAGMIKSAQFPFHTWLPQTLETPTPVSALMHAGIVNAGGFLIIRSSQVVATTPWALGALASIGALTALYAAIVMMTQTSVKKTLAYSTIAQMGFMMLQCGLGAYSAALLHIVAHSMYKAYAFLSSGTLSPQRVISSPAAGSEKSRSLNFLAAAGCSLTAVLMTSWAVGTPPGSKPGGLILGAVLCLALAQWLERVFATGDRTLAIRGIATALGLSLLYAVSYRIVDGVVGASVPSAALASADLQMLQWAAVGWVTIGGFAGLYAVQRLKTNPPLSAGAGRWFIHASNGFYLESGLRRLVGPLSAS